MKKRILTILLVMILAVTNLSVCYADGVNDLANIGLDNYQQAINNNDFSGGRNWNNGIIPPDEDSDSASGIIALIIRIFTFIPEKIVQLILEILALIIPMMDSIVFNGEGTFTIWDSFCKLSYFDANAGIGVAGHMVGAVSAFYQTFRYVALIGFVVAIAAIAVKMIVSSIGKQRQQYKEALKNWLIGLVLLIVGHWIMIYAIYFSDYLVSLIYKIKEAVIDPTSNSLIAAFSRAVTESALGTAAIWPIYMLALVMAIIAIIIFVSMNLKIFKVYLERVIVVGVLIMLFPIVTIFYAFEKSGIKKGSTFESWLRTFIDQVFIQPIHAITLVFIILALNAVSGSGIIAIPIIGMVVFLMVLNMMFSIENIVKRVFAINGASMGSPINPMGAVMSAAGMAAPMIKGGHAASKIAKADGKGVVGRTWAGLKAGARMAATGKYGKKNAQMLAGLMGASIPDEVFNVDRLSQKEQKDAVKRIKKASLNVKGAKGSTLYNDVRNLEHMMDSEILADVRRKCGVDNRMIKDFALNGESAVVEAMPETTAKEKAAKEKARRDAEARYKLYLHALAEADTDLDAYAPGGDIDVEAVNGLSFDDDDIKNNAKVARRSVGSFMTDKDSDDAKRMRMARKIYAARNSDKYDKLVRESGLDATRIAAIEDGTNSDSDDLLSYKIMMERINNPKLEQDDFELDGARSYIAYGANIMNTADRMSQANALSSSGDLMKHDMSEGRKVLQSFKMADEEKLYRCARNKGVDVNRILDYINSGDTTGLDNKALRGVLEELVRTK